jgi:CHASE3 domain sensor protein
MIRKIALQASVLALIALMAGNGYLAMNHLRRIKRSASFGPVGSPIQANISAISQDLTDMETGQRGYLLTEDNSYLQPYTDGKNRIVSHLTSLRSALADRSDEERSMVEKLASLAASKQDEIERTIILRQKGYRHRAFVLVNTNEGKDYMDRARELLSSLSSTEGSRFVSLEKQRSTSLSKSLSEASSGTIMANSSLVLLAAVIFTLVFYFERWLEQQATRSHRMLFIRDLEMERLISSLSNQTRSEIAVIEENARLLIVKFGGFLPTQGYEYAEQIRDAADELERLRKNMLNRPDPEAAQKAA